MSQTSCGEEWWECSYCFDAWFDLTDHSMEWFEGRVPLVMWLRAKGLVGLGYGTWSHCRLRWALRCHIGWHKYEWERDVCQTHRICRFCYGLEGVDLEDA